jgi:hypothetical protein
MSRTLTISTGTSRGRDTYGYTIVRLRDSDTGKLYRCMGGGYDMVGTVLADWLTDVHQDALRTIRDRAYYISDTGRFAPSKNPEALYGMTKYTDGRVSIDGACGVESVRRIATAAGVKLRSFPTRDRRNTGGWTVEED